MDLARGTVGERTWGCVFTGFSRDGATAELVVGTGDKALRVVFHAGAVVAAWSPLASDSAARVGMTLNMVTSTQVVELTKRLAAAGGRDEIEVIAEALRLAPELAQRMRRRTIALRAARTFAMEGSPYVLDDQLTLGVVPGGELDARGVLYLGARTHLSAERLARDVRALGGEVVMTQDIVDDLPQFGFGDLELPVVAALQGGESVAALHARSSESERRVVHAVVYALASWANPEGGHSLPGDPPVSAPADNASSSTTFRKRPTSMPPTTNTIPPPNASRLTPPPIARTTTPPPMRSAAAAAAAASLLSQVSRGSQPRVGSATGAPPSGTPAAAAAPAAPAVPALTEMEKAQREATEAQRRGEAALRREQFALAIEEFTKATQFNPRNGIHAAYLAWAQFCAATDKRLVAAETRRALERAQGDTEEVTPLLFRGRVERMLGREREALRIFNEILALEPGHVEARLEARVLEQRLSNRGSRPK